MSQYDDTNKGAIWANQKKLTDRHPDFTGQANVDGAEYWVSAWRRGPGDKPNSPSLRFSLTPKEERKDPVRDERPADTFEDEIPF